ncbi:fasciclin domain-containing protein [Phenylobacterium sp.]|jgi:uncharacterized surface protein with fasciclin (FAS1) repeats|uniref:fasciclin domain-containing protein n=1 Tax=Phenylobacterium sp. TaxID=1871053 RepID=UPI002F922350
MPINRLLTAAAASALVAALALPAAAQTTSTAKTEAAAKAATGKATSDKPAGTAVQGTAKAVKDGAAPAAAGAGANVQATAAATTPAPSNTKAVAAQGDLVDTLKLSGQFNTFVKAIDSTNLTQLLKTNKNLTVFAPTDAAFAAMPAGELAKLQADKVAMQKFVLHHIINAPVDTTKIKGARGPVPSGAQDNILLDGSDEAGTLKADGATIVQADLKTSSGMLHIVDKPLVAGAGGTAEPAQASAPASTGAGSDASAAAAKPKT